MPSYFLDSLMPQLAAWVRRLELDRRPGLSGFFTSTELESGSAAMELYAELGTVPEADFARFAGDLDKLVEFSQLQAGVRRRGFATTPEYVFQFERRIREREERRASAEQRLRDLGLQQQRAALPPLPPQPRLGHRHRRPHPPAATAHEREQAEAGRRKKWISKLYEVLLEMDAPVLKLISRSSRPRELLDSHMGGRRAATLAARLRAWARYRQWLRQGFGVGRASAPHHILDYLLDRRAEPCTRGTSSAVFSMFRFVDDALGLPVEERWSVDPVVVMMAKGIIAQAAASVSRRSQGPANAPLVSVLAKLEQTVCDAATPTLHRLLSWWMLVSAWTASRFDDHRGLAPQDVHLVDGRLEAVFKRTKSTGDDKPVRHRHTVVSADAWIVDSSWLSCGWSLWNEKAPRARDFFLVQWNADGNACYKELGYSEYAGRMRGVLSGLKCAQGEPLGSEWATYLRPHSWRCFLPSAAVALGAPADSLKWISAWRAQSSEAYVRTSRVRTLTIQATTAKLIRLHLGGADPVGESQSLERLRKHMDERGCEGAEVERVIESLTIFSNQTSSTSLWNTIAGPTGDGSSMEGADGITAEAVTDAQVQELASTSEEEATRTAPADGYVVATSRRRGTRCLHRIGLCYRKPGTHYLVYRSYGEIRPPVTDYDVYCKDCWRQTSRKGATSAAMLGSDTGSSRRTSSSSSSTTDASDA